MSLNRRASAGMAAMLAGLVRFGVTTRRNLDGSKAADISSGG